MTSVCMNVQPLFYRNARVAGPGAGGVGSALLAATASATRDGALQLVRESANRKMSVGAATPPAPLPATPRHRRGALWPWLVTPLVTLALFFALHNERKTSAPVPGGPTAATPER